MESCNEFNRATDGFNSSIVESAFQINSGCRQKRERQILKLLALTCLNKIFFELFECKNDLLKEYYVMDSTIIQRLIRGIVATGEYTLEGIALHTRIPFDVIYDAALGIKNQISITPWSRIVNLYIQVNPDLKNILLNKLKELIEQNHVALTFLLNDENFDNEMHS